MYGNHANHNNAQQAKPEGYTNPFVFSYVHVISYIPVVVFLFVWEFFSPCSSGGPGTYYVDHTFLEFEDDPLATVSQVLSL